ncbi:hypothetical protein [Prosthecobacter sp.]|uniref:hypothetical protein n=1 Tax=Prosthecobacter sp. TaxID=1965333 RepID=UPI0037850482
MKTLTCLICLLLSVLTSPAADFDLGTRGTLSVGVPEDWTVNGKAVNDPDGTPIGYAFAFKPRSEAHAKCLLTFGYTTNGAPNKDDIQEKVLRATEQFVPGSVEKKQNLKDFSPGTGCGFYCLFTDASLVGKAAKPDDYKVMGSGVVQPGDNMVGVVSLFADEAEGVEMKAMLKIISSLEIKPGKTK